MLKTISEKLIKIISRNFGWKLFSVVCAIVLWFIVMNIINPTEIQTYSVNITFLNQDKLAEKGFVIMNKEEIESTKIEIKVKSTRTALDELNKNRKDITATVDLKQFAMIYADDVKEPFKVAVTPNIPKSYVHTYELVNFTPGEISIQLDNVVQEEREIVVDSEGEFASGYLEGDAVVEPNKVKIKGASTDIQKLESVKVFVDVSDASEEIVQDLKPIAYDKDGNEMDSLVIEPGTVQVNLGVYKYGQILVEKPSVEGTLPQNVKIEKIDWEPEYIEVVGNEDEISAVGSIKPVVKINEQMIGNNGKITKTYDVNAHLAKNKLSIKSGTKKEVTVTLTLTKEKGEKEIVFNNSNITIIGRNDDDIVFLSSEVKTKIKGEKEILDKVNQDSVSASIDVTGLPEGKHSVPIVPKLPENVSLTEENVNVEIQIVKKDNSNNLSIGENNNNNENTNSSSSNNNNNNSNSNNSNSNNNDNDNNNGNGNNNNNNAESANGDNFNNETVSESTSQALEN